MYAELILPLALEQSYHYQLPSTAEPPAQSFVGRRAVVSFGRKRFYTGIIAEVYEDLPQELQGRPVKTIEGILDEYPLVSPALLSLWRWMADYYQCSLGQVMRVAMPGGLLPESKTLIYIYEDFQSETSLPELDYRILDTLREAGQSGLTLEALQTRIGQGISRSYHRLLALGAIHTEETVVSRYRPRTRAHLRLAERYRSAEGLVEAYALLGRAKRQQELLAEFWLYIEERALPEAYAACVPRVALSRADSARSAVIKKLVDRGVLEVLALAESRLTATEPSLPTSAGPTMGYIQLSSPVSYLSTPQVEQKQTAIIQLVRQCIAEGRQVLLLSPTAQDSPVSGAYHSALASAAGGRLYYYHPQVNEHKRSELYQLLASGAEPCIVLGTRTALFLPFDKLGLIIVDEEQEYMYKQQHTAPYFHARDVALYLGAKQQIPVVLASASPSAEATFNLKRGKYRALELGPIPIVTGLPEIKTIDLKELRQRGQIPYGSSISTPLCQMIQQELLEGRRVLLLQNRRGYAPYVLCAACRSGIDCPHCDVSLNYYASHRLLRCHYCGYSSPMPTACPSCNESQVEHKGKVRPALQLVGYGSERIEEEVQELFPDARILRLDSDSLQSVSRRQEVHDRIAAGDVDIIVGTQLIKGQPVWDNIGLIAVVQLESLLGFPDFRSEERTYQLLYQLMLHSRVGHSGRRTQLVLQTAQPEQPFIASLRQQDYDAFIEEQLAIRQITAFPPFYRLSTIRLKAFSEELVTTTANALVLYLRQHLEGIWVSDVQTPSIARIDGQYIREVMCRRPYAQGYQSERIGMRLAEQQLRHYHPESRRVQIHYDIDPL